MKQMGWRAASRLPHLAATLLQLKPDRMWVPLRPRDAREGRGRSVHGYYMATYCKRREGPSQENQQGVSELRLSLRLFVTCQCEV